jgi:hypothetical protein
MQHLQLRSPELSLALGAVVIIIGNVLSGL